MQRLLPSQRASGHRCPALDARPQHPPPPPPRAVLRAVATLASKVKGVSTAGGAAGGGTAGDVIVADGSSAGRPGTEGSKGSPHSPGLHRQQGSEGAPEWACLGEGPASPMGSASSRGQDQAGGDRTHPGRSAKAAGDVFSGWPLRAPSTRPGAVPARAYLGVGRPPAAGREGSRYCRHRGPRPPRCWSAAHLPSQGTLQSGAQKGAHNPPAAWPKVTETTHKSQKFVQTHPPPSPGQGSRPAASADSRGGCGCGRSARRQEAGLRPEAAAAPSSSGRPTCATAGPPGCARSSRPRRTRPRAAGSAGPAPPGRSPLRSAR